MNHSLYFCPLFLDLYKIEQNFDHQGLKLKCKKGLVYHSSARLLGSLISLACICWEWSLKTKMEGQPGGEREEILQNYPEVNDQINL